MTKEKILKTLSFYKDFINKLIPTYDGPYDKNQLNHILTMLPKMEVFIEEGRIEKTMRWLGFIQGILWSWGIFTLEELKLHNYEG